MRLLVWIVLAPLGLLAVAFAVANRAPVVVSLDPLPIRLALPLYLVVFAALFVGLILGWIVTRVSLWRRAPKRVGAETPPARSPAPREAIPTALPPPAA
jgi:uncharacterized integral membrane protein